MTNDFQRLQELEKEIKKIRWKSVLITAIVLLALSAPFAFETEAFAFLFVVFISFPLGFAIAEIATGSQKRERDYIFKYGFVKTALSEVFDDLAFDPDNGLQEKFLEQTGMIDTGDVFSSNDLVTGTYKGTWFTQSDVLSEDKHETTDSDGHTHTTYTTNFKGRFIVFDFNKSFSSNFLVVQKKVSGYRVPGRRINGTKYKKYPSEDEEFNNRFTVYCDNVTSPYTILTQEFMDKLKRVDDKTEGGLIICFFENRLYIGINDHTNAFELDLKKTPTEEQMVRKIMYEVHVITDLIDDIVMDNIGFTE